MKPLILLDAAPFCYGPISTLMAVIHYLPTSKYRLVLLASGTSLEFAQPYAHLVEIVQCDTESETELRQQIDLFKTCALFVSNTNPPSVVFAKKLGTPVAYIDTLFWMWDHLAPEVAASDVYIAQDFIGVSESLHRIGSDIKHFEIVKPLIDTQRGGLPLELRAAECLVSYGGMESSLTIPGITNQLHLIQTKLLMDVLAKISPFDHYYFCGRGHVMETLAATHPDPRYEFGFFKHDDYLELLRRCKLCFLSPGLTGSYEAVSAGTPTVFLLPQNYSQQLQAQQFLESSDWPMVGVEWRSVYPDFELPDQLPEAEAIARLNQLIRRFENDPPAWHRYVSLLIEQVRQMPTAAQNSTITSGAEKTAHLITQLAAELVGAAEASPT